MRICWRGVFHNIVHEQKEKKKDYWQSACRHLAPKRVQIACKSTLDVRSAWNIFVCRPYDAHKISEH